MPGCRRSLAFTALNLRKIDRVRQEGSSGEDEEGNTEPVVELKDVRPRRSDPDPDPDPYLWAKLLEMLHSWVSSASASALGRLRLVLDVQMGQQQTETYKRKAPGITDVAGEVLNWT